MSEGSKSGGGRRRRSSSSRKSSGSSRRRGSTDAPGKGKEPAGVAEAPAAEASAGRNGSRSFLDSVLDGEYTDMEVLADLQIGEVLKTVATRSEEFISKLPFVTAIGDGLKSAGDSLARAGRATHGFVKEIFKRESMQQPAPDPSEAEVLEYHSMLKKSLGNQKDPVGRKIHMWTMTFNGTTSKTASQASKETIAFVAEVHGQLCVPLKQVQLHQVALLVLEDRVFGSIYDNLFSVYTDAYGPVDEQLAVKCTLMNSVTPQDLEVRPAFCPAADAAENPYQKPIDRMSELIQLRVPRRKVQKLVRIAKDICKAAATCSGIERANKRTSAIGIGADDLIPLFAYVILQSNVKNLYSESMLLADFVDDASVRAEEGYALATLQCCIKYIREADWPPAQAS